MKAPFPYFGGKSKVAPIVWQALGDVRHYIEPFFGSGAVLLNRPDYDLSRHVETVNDKDGHLANVWRAIQHAPEETARYADWPVNHADLRARRLWLSQQSQRLIDSLATDPDWYDAKAAGWWIWAASCWIGSGMMTGGEKRPNIAHGGRGVHKLAMREQRPHIGDGGAGVHALSQRGGIYAWFEELAARLRHVRVVCGDWTRVCGGNWQDKIGTVGVFFDPPYGAKATRATVYAHDSHTVADDVREWCIERGSRDSYRIVLAGYYEEHEKLLNHGWRVYRWNANGGYANQGNGRGRANRGREALFLSPHCAKVETAKEQMDLI